MRKYYILLAFLFAFGGAIYSQTSSITNIQVSQQTDNSGLVDVYFDLSGPYGDYYLSMSVSFDGGSTFTPIGSNFLSQDIGPINPGTNKHIIWDGGQSFPDTYSIQSQLKITALKSDCGGTCGDPITDIDGNTYNTVLIGNQCWMRENLKTTHYSDGTILVDGTGVGNITGDYTTKYYFNYNDNPSLVETYGQLYTWAAAMNGSSSNTDSIGPQGVCPADWHVPSDAEWKELEMFLGMSSEQANATQFRGAECGKLREVGTQHWMIPNSGATNSSGFTALPGGGRYHSSGEFHDIYGAGEFWSATSEGDHASFFRIIFVFSDGVYRDPAATDMGFSIRCIKN